jgi:hypothetical protein
VGAALSLSLSSHLQWQGPQHQDSTIQVGEHAHCSHCATVGSMLRSLCTIVLQCRTLHCELHCY